MSRFSSPSFPVGAPRVVCCVFHPFFCSTLFCFALTGCCCCWARIMGPQDPLGGSKHWTAWSSDGLCAFSLCNGLKLLLYVLDTAASDTLSSKTVLSIKALVLCGFIRVTLCPLAKVMTFLLYLFWIKKKSSTADDQSEKWSPSMRKLAS